MPQMHFPDFRLAGRHTHRSLASLVWSSYIWDQALGLSLIQRQLGPKPPACGVGAACITDQDGYHNDFLHHVRREVTPSVWPKNFHTASIRLQNICLALFSSGFGGMLIIKPSYEFVP